MLRDIPSRSARSDCSNLCARGGGRQCHSPVSRTAQATVLSIRCPIILIVPGTMGAQNEGTKRGQARILTAPSPFRPEFVINALASPARLPATGTSPHSTAKPVFLPAIPCHSRRLYACVGLRTREGCGYSGLQLQLPLPVRVHRSPHCAAKHAPTPSALVAPVHSVRVSQGVG